MADATPADVADEGQTPSGDEGQTPDTSTSTTGDDSGDSGQKPTTPRVYPEAYVRQLRREASESRKRLDELEAQAREHADRGKSEVERLTERATKNEQRAADAEARLVRFEVAAERGLDGQAAKFLTGSSREEIEAQADELAKLLDERRPKPTPSFDGGARQPVPDPTTPEEAHNALLLQAFGRTGRAT